MSRSLTAFLLLMAIPAACAPLCPRAPSSKGFTNSGNGLDPIDFCASLEAGENYGDASGGKDAIGQHHPQTIDVCEKIAKLSFGGIDVVIEAKVLDLALEKERLSSCQSELRRLESAPIGLQYQELIRAADQSAPCLSSILSVIDYEQLDRKDFSFSMSPQRAVASFANRFQLDGLGEMRVVSDYYSFPISVSSNPSSVRITCLIVREIGDDVPLREDFAKFDCLAKL
ncbi:MAG: hypothetical protein R3D99_08510 [Altererythrobacter sp.]